MSDFAAFARGSICSTFIDTVPLIEIARATSTIEMAPSVLMDGRKEWEDTFTKKFYASVLLWSRVLRIYASVKPF